MRRRPITEIQAPSSAVEGYRLRKIICRLASATLRNPSAVADVELAVGEAFTNAVKHGDGGSKVSVRVESSPGRELAVEMAYSGKSFDTQVTYPKDITSANGGFGRYIMNSVMDSMRYDFNNGMTVLRITKRR